MGAYSKVLSMLCYHIITITMRWHIPHICHKYHKYICVKTKVHRILQKQKYQVGKQTIEAWSKGWCIRSIIWRLWRWGRRTKKLSFFRYVFYLIILQKYVHELTFFLFQITIKIFLYSMCWPGCINMCWVQKGISWGLFISHSKWKKHLLVQVGQA